MSEQNPNWHVTACVHHPITPTQSDGLFDVVADAAHGWEPAGVDVDVSGGPCYCREVVGTRPPWQVHDSPPPTHGTPGAEPVTGAGWNNRTWATELIAAAREPVLGVEPVFVADDADYLEALLADRDNLSIDVEREQDRVALTNTALGEQERMYADLTADRDRLAAELSNAREWLDLRTSELASANSQRDAALAERDRLHTWHGLMSVLDQHYPPNVPLGPDSDPGPRILALTRALDAARAELATARRDAAADALLMVRQRFEERTDGDGNIDTGWWLMWLQAWAAEVRTGQRTIIPQSATTTDDLPEWEQDIVFPATDTTEEP
jgi:hypothetical protein